MTPIPDYDDIIGRVGDDGGYALQAAFYEFAVHHYVGNTEACPACGGDGCFEHSRPFWDDPYFCEVEPCASCRCSGVVEVDYWSGGLDLSDLHDRCGDA